ncbi:MAG: hypothetical protein ACRERU_05375 [Methylococcales bacterium]
MATETFEPIEWRIKTLLNDLNMAVDLSRSQGTSVPTSGLAARLMLYTRAVAFWNRILRPGSNFTAVQVRIEAEPDADPGRKSYRFQCRKAAISVFVILHFCALIVWMIPPYAGMVIDSPHAGSLTVRIEQRLFRALAPDDGGVVAILTRNYIDLLGAYQYWDFFAPDTPRIHRYLSVCTDILESRDKRHIECLDPVYQSFEGNIEDAAHAHHGNRSRAFRLVENLFRLRRPDLMNAFTLYWRHQKHFDAAGRSYLLLHEFTLRPDSLDAKSTSGSRDELIWVAPE